MTHRISCPLQSLQSSNNMHHYHYWKRGRIKMGVVLITHCLCYPDWALRWFPLLSKIILIVSGVAQCFYWMCMFIWQIHDDILSDSNMFYQYLFDSNKIRDYTLNNSFKTRPFNQLVEIKQKRGNPFFCLVFFSFSFGLRFRGAFLTAT